MWQSVYESIRGNVTHSIAFILVSLFIVAGNADIGAARLLLHPEASQNLTSNGSQVLRTLPCLLCTPDSDGNSPFWSCTEHKNKMFYHRQVLFSVVSSVQFSSRGPCMTGQEGHSESLIKCGMNTERSLSLASQAMSLHLSFPRILLSSPLLLSNWEGASRDILLSYATSTYSLCQVQHTNALWVGDIPLPLWGTVYEVFLEDADLKARQGLWRAAQERVNERWEIFLCAGRLTFLSLWFKKSAFSATVLAWWQVKNKSINQ